MSSNNLLLKGLPVSSGKATRRVLIAKPDDFRIPKRQDSFILVTEFTTPMQSMLISKSVGIVVEQGGIGSHSAIVAREFGIPCIVAKDTIKTLKKKVIISVDGTNGTIYG